MRLKIISFKFFNDKKWMISKRSCFKESNSFKFKDEMFHVKHFIFFCEFELSTLIYIFIHQGDCTCGKKEDVFV